MEENCLAYRIEISDSDWDLTPARVKQLVEKMGQHIKKSEEKLAELEAKQQELLEKINCTSKNSSSPPSSSFGDCVERTVPPQSKDGAECNARYIWNKHVFGYSQQPKT